MNTEETKIPIPNEWYKEPSRKGVHIVSICVICLVVLALIATMLYCFPRQTPIDVTLNAVKLDEDGNEIGTAQLHISGRYVNYFLLEDKLELQMDPVDGIVQIGKCDDAHLPYSLGDQTGTEYWMHSMSGFDPDANSITFGYLVFTKEFDCIAYLTSTSGKEVCYVGSVSDNMTTQELIDYFNGIVPGK